MLSFRSKHVGLGICVLLLITIAGCNGSTKVLPGGGAESSPPVQTQPGAAGKQTPGPANPEVTSSVITDSSLKEGTIPTGDGIPVDAVCWTPDGRSYLRQSGSGKAKQITLFINGTQAWQRASSTRTDCAPDLDWIVTNGSDAVQVIGRDGQVRWTWQPPTGTWVTGVDVMAAGQALLIELGESSRKGYQLLSWVDLRTPTPTLTPLPEAGNFKVAEGAKLIVYEDPDRIRFHDGNGFLEASTYEGMNARTLGLSLDGARALILDPTSKQVVYRRLTDGKGWSTQAPTDLGGAVLARDGSAVWLLYPPAGSEPSARLVMMDASGKVRAERRVDAKLDPVLRDLTTKGEAVVQVETAKGALTCLVSAEGESPICYPIYGLDRSGGWALVGRAESQRWYPISQVR